MGIIEKSGAWFSYNGDRIGQGKEKAKQFLEENPDIMAEIEEKIKTGEGALETIDTGSLLDDDNFDVNI